MKQRLNHCTVFQRVARKQTWPRPSSRPPRPSAVRPPSSCWLMMTDWRGRICEERKGERKGRERREGNLVCRRSSVEWKGGRKWMSGWVSGWGPMHIWCLQNFAIFRPLSLCPHYLTDLYYKIQRYPRNRATHNRSNRILVQNLVGPNHQNGL